MTEERLRKLIEHWVEHNDEHKNRYEESAIEAVNIGLDTVALNLKKAAEKAEDVSKYLKKALEKFKLY